MAEQMIYTVPGMTCNHCKHSVSTALSAVAGVTGVDVDLSTKLVTVKGANLDDQALREAIAAAGYQAA